MKRRIRRLILRERETILAAVPETCAGPGWQNTVVWVYIRRMDGLIRSECLQPLEQSDEMLTLFDAGEAMCDALKAAIPVRRTVKRRLQVDPLTTGK